MTPFLRGGPAIMAEFKSEEAVQRAALRLREKGYREIEIYSPYPVAGSTALLGQRRPYLNWLVFLCAMTGAALAFIVQWWANAENYPINVGGRPLFSLPAWVPIIFEMGVLAAGFTALFGMLGAVGLPRFWHPVFEVPGFERVTLDRFWISIDRGDPLFDPVGSRYDLEALEPIQVALVEVP